MNTHPLNVTNNSEISASVKRAETYLIALICAVIAVIAVFGNILVILAVYINTRLQTKSNYLLVALAVPDFFQGAVSLPLRLVEVLDVNCDLKSFCPVAIPVSTLFGAASNLHILLVAVERSVSIFFPYCYYSWMTTKKVLMGVCVIWLSVVTVSLLPVLGWGGKEPETVVTFCRFPSFLIQEYITCLYLFVHVIPIIVVTFLNVFILRESLHHLRRIEAQVVSCGFNLAGRDSNSQFFPQPVEAVRQKKVEAMKQRKTTFIVAAVVGSFILLVVPIVTIDIVEMLTAAVIPEAVVKIAVLMIYANHCVNVFVYAGLNSDYRRAFKNILKKCVNVFRLRRTGGHD